MYVRCINCIFAKATAATGCSDNWLHMHTVALYNVCKHIASQSVTGQFFYARDSSVWTIEFSVKGETIAL